MNPYHHCLALADHLDGAAKAYGLHEAVEACKTSLDRDAQNGAVAKAFRVLLTLLMPAEFAELFLPEKELITIQKEAEILGKAARHFRAGLPEAFTIFVSALCDPPVSSTIPPPPTPSGSPMRKTRRKRRAQPPRAPLGR